MEKKLTAMQELIRLINKNCKPTEVPIVDGIRIVAQNLLFNEKQQMVAAHLAGQKFASDNDNPDSEEYYNQTFTTSQPNSETPNK